MRLQKLTGLERDKVLEVARKGFAEDGETEPTTTVHLDGFDLIGEKSLVGTYMGGLVPGRDIPELARLVAAGELQVAPLVDRITLDDVPAAVDRLRAGAQRARQVAVLGDP